MLQLIQIRFLTAALLMLPIANIGAAEQKAGLEIGIAPFLPIKTLVQNYAPLREYLQNRLNEPVTIVSAADHKTYYQRILKREYPIIIANTNAAYLAWFESAYVPLLQPINLTHPVLVVANSRPFKQLNELRDKTIAMSDATAIVSMKGVEILREAGLEPGQNVSIVNTPNFSAAINHVITGEVAAAIVSDRALLQISPAVREQVKTVYTWGKSAAPGVVYLGSPDMPRDRLEKIKNFILEFAQTTPEGKKLMADMGYGGLQTIGADDLRPLAPYGALLKKALGKEP